MKKLVKKSLAALLAVLLALPLAFSGVSAEIVYDTIEETDRPYYDTADHSCYYTWYRYYDQMASIPLTGDGARDAVAIALSQVGYLEGSDSGHSGVSGGSGNYTEYAEYMNHGDGAAWCATFCSWAYYVSGARSPYYSSAFWNGAYVPTWSSTMGDYGLYRDSYYNGGSYVPKTGDTVYFVHDYSSGWKYYEDHIGIVVYTDDSYVYTIEGNTSSQAGVESDGGGVFFKKYSLWSPSLCGFGVQPFATVSGLPELDYSGANPTPGLYVAAETDVGMYSDKAYSWLTTVPMGTMFEVLEIDYDSNGAPLLYSKVKLDNEYYYGYILHGSGTNGCNRTLQIYASPNTLSMDTDVYEVTDGKIDTLGVKKTAASFIADFTISDASKGSIVVYGKDGAELDSAALVGTGSKICLLDNNGEVQTEISVVVKSDVDGDGKATAFDYLMVRRRVMGTLELEDYELAAAAVVNGKTVSAFDYLLLKRVVIGTYILGN